MASATIWSRRVASWRASGQTSDAFCSGKEFTAGKLRSWSSRLRRREGGEVESPVATTPVIRIGRVLRQGASPDSDVAPARPAIAAERPEAIVVEVGVARVAVRPGFDRETLVAVLEVLVGQGDAP